MKAPETDEAFCQWYEDCWADRDEVEYPKLFGAISEEVFTLEQSGALEAWLESDLAEVQEHYYREPPRIERGWRHFLVTEEGRPLLDMVNNVAVVGHSHPRLPTSLNPQTKAQSD